MFLIIQTGDPVKLALEQYGRFDDWFIQSLGITADQAMVIDVHRGQSLPDINTLNLTAVVITGSASMITEHTEWMTQTQLWLESAMAQKTPIMGVCFGHQLLADMLGGRVDYNPKGRNMGISQCVLNAAGTDDPLFSGISITNHFNTFVSHQQSVLQLPNTVKVLASCQQDEHHVFSYQNHVWGVQFHPEWNQDIMRTYLQQRKIDILAEGLDPILMLAQLKACPEANALLNKFTNLVSSR